MVFSKRNALLGYATLWSLRRLRRRRATRRAAWVALLALAGVALAAAGAVSVRRRSRDRRGPVGGEPPGEPEGERSPLDRQPGLLAAPAT